MKYILLLLLTMLTMLSSAQMTDEQLSAFVENAEPDELTRENYFLLSAGNFYQALIVSEKLLEMQPDNSNFNYRHGFALLNSQSDFTLPLPYLEKAILNISSKYDDISFNETNSPIDVIYYLGKCYHLDEQLDQAQKNYELFIQRSNKNSELVELANRGIIQVNNARDIMAIEKNYQLVNLGSTVNFEGPDYAPVVSLDGTALYFTSRRLRPDSLNEDIREYGTNLYLEDIYVSFTDFDDEWQEPQLMEFCLPEQNEATVAVSADERRIYMYKDSEGAGDIFYSDFSSNSFQDVIHLENEDINKPNSWEPHLTVTPDGQQIYFTSDRPGGYGGSDIYRVVKLPNGEWSKPINLGPEINTRWDEDSPFIAVDNKTLYYSSNGEESMGGYDVFITIRNESGKWSTPINLGYPLNSTGDDLYYTTTVDGLTGYLTSFRKGGVGEKDIYEIKNDNLGLDNIAVLKGEIETVGNKPLPEDIAITVKCLDCGDGIDKTVFPRMRDGVFFSSLEPCRKYELIFHYDNGKTVFHKENVETSCELKYDEVYRHFLLDVDELVMIPEKEKLPSYCALSFKHFFGYNKNKLNIQKGEFKVFLDSIANQFEAGRSKVELNITSSASKVRTRSFQNNQVLAESRANQMKIALEEYFANKVYKDSIIIQVKNASVNGPDYKRGSRRRLDLYGPHQFVAVEASAFNCINDIPVLKSKDKELSNVTSISTVTEIKKPAVSENPTTAENAIEQAKEITEVNKADDTEIYKSVTNYTYHVVSGAFRRIDYANGFIARLKMQGYKDAKVIGKVKGLLVVSAEGFNTLGDAKAALPKIKKDANPSSYIFNLSKK